MHCDLKPSKILLDKDSGSVKVVGFGHAVDMQKTPDDHSGQNQYELVKWKSYEVVCGQGSRKYEVRDDCFSCGLII